VAVAPRAATAASGLSSSTSSLTEIASYLCLSTAENSCATMGVLEQSIEALKLLAPILDMVPAIGGNLKGAAELASGICEMIKVRGHCGDLFSDL
jgi:hypothetical protein